MYPSYLYQNIEFDKDSVVFIDCTFVNKEDSDVPVE